jgi:hypothetical protein
MRKIHQAFEVALKKSVIGQIKAKQRRECDRSLPSDFGDRNQSLGHPTNHRTPSSETIVPTAKTSCGYN